MGNEFQGQEFVKNYNPDDLGSISTEETAQMSLDILNLVGGIEDNKVKQLFLKLAKYYKKSLVEGSTYEIRNILDNLYDKIEKAGDYYSELINLESLCNSLVEAERNKPHNILENSNASNVIEVDFEKNSKKEIA